MRQSLVLATVALRALAAAPEASGHEYWLSPSTYRARQGDTVAIAAFVGTGFQGERRPYAAPRTLQLTVSSSRTLDLSRVAVNGDLAWARFVAADDGGALVAYRSNFAFIELPATDFDRYLTTEGLDGPRRARSRAPSSRPVRERYARCPKTWIAGGQAARATRRLGLPFELVPLTDPVAGGRLRIMALFRGKPLPGTLVRAWNHRLATPQSPTDAAVRDSVGPAAQARTDRNGIATVEVGRAGEWLISAVHMVPCSDRGEADWESYWASLTFASRATLP